MTDTFVMVQIIVSDASSRIPFRSAFLNDLWRNYLPLGISGASRSAKLRALKRVFKALIDKSRLQIIETIIGGTANPGRHSQKLDRNKSRVEKHLRVLQRAGLVEKVPRSPSRGNCQSSMRFGKDAFRIVAE